jgi:hypothetical protein
MSEDDPLAELSAAARKKPTPSRLPPRGAYPAPSMRTHHYPNKPQPKSLLVPILIAVGILAVGVPAGIILTMKLLEPGPPPPTTHVIIKDAPAEHQQGELFKSVPTQDPKKAKKPEKPDKPETESPPPE